MTTDEKIIATYHWVRKYQNSQEFQDAINMGLIDEDLQELEAEQNQSLRDLGETLADNI